MPRTEITTAWTFRWPESRLVLRQVSRDFFLQNSTYYTLTKWLVLARGTRFGVQQTLGNTLSADIPLPERFFAGGGTSLRGFGFNQAGPRDPVTGFPVGGQAHAGFQSGAAFPAKASEASERNLAAQFFTTSEMFSVRSARSLCIPRHRSLRRLRATFVFVAHSGIWFSLQHSGWPGARGPCRIKLIRRNLSVMHHWHAGLFANRHAADAACRISNYFLIWEMFSDAGIRAHIDGERAALACRDAARC